LSASIREKWEDSKVNMWPAGWGITEGFKEWWDVCVWGGSTDVKMDEKEYQNRSKLQCIKYPSVTLTTIMHYHQRMN